MTEHALGTETPELETDTFNYPPLGEDIPHLPKVEGQAFTQAQIPLHRIEIEHTVFQNSRPPGFSTNVLEESIDAQGLEDPIVVWRHHYPSGYELNGEIVYDRFFAIAGFRRVFILQEKSAQDPEWFEERFPRVPVHIYEGELIGAMLHNLSENFSKEPPSALDFGRYCVKIREMGYSQREIARHAGVSESWVSKCIKLATDTNVSEKVREKLERGEIDTGTALALASEDVEKQEEWVEKFDALRTGSEEEQAQADDLKNEKRTTPRPKPSKSPGIRSADELRRTRDELLARNLDAGIEAMRYFDDILDDEGVEHFVEALLMASVYGTQKALIFACGERVKWEATRPPFVIDPETNEVVYSKARETLHERIG